MLDVICQGFRDLCGLANCAPVEDTNRRWVYQGLQFLVDGSINQISGWLEDENSVVISDEVTGSVNYLMGLAGAAGSGTVFDTHGIPIDDLFGIYHLLSDKWYRVPSRTEEPKRGCKFS